MDPLLTNPPNSTGFLKDMEKRVEKKERNYVLRLDHVHVQPLSVCACTTTMVYIQEGPQIINDNMFKDFWAHALRLALKTPGHSSSLMPEWISCLANQLFGKGLLSPREVLFHHSCSPRKKRTYIFILVSLSLKFMQKELVKLFTICHSRMEEVVPKSTTLRLVAFNLGYLPGGDKEVTTTSATTILALQAATRILASGGLISLIVYVGHPGGRDELETIQAFASELSVEDWVCSEFQMLNRPLAPVLIFLFKR
ncbi:putative rRNA methylase YtqB [Vitis vinifera]|uniref:Putative rRNA methylase YtqB n=1 Tax=Vitis vinifera TaxID=29760 RepID=A0A438HYS7_VITVI|nr:putative rRNA methylase YtqB [Vitis vinifera]